jgi:predicted RNA-binding Zn-ribbon protein involved in translation (DUF1610 family)
MSYFEVRVTDMVFDVGGRPLSSHRLCTSCGRPLDPPLEYTDLVIQAKQRLSQDALRVFCLPSILVSPAFAHLLNSLAPRPFSLYPVRLTNGRRFRYQLLRCTATLQSSVLAFQPGSACPKCGQATLNLDRLILKAPGTTLPPLARLTEAPGILLLGPGLAQSCLAAGLDLELQPVHFEGEPIPDAGSTFSEGPSWADL